MLLNLGAGWLFLAIVVVAILSFILAMALNAILGGDGFGANGNAAIITIGFFMAIVVANSLGYTLTDLRLAIATGLGGAFVCLTTLIGLKAVLSRT